MATASEEEDSSDGRLAGVISAVDSLGAMVWPFGADEDETIEAELVDGAEVLFVDRQAKTKDAHEFDLVVLDAPEYPEPAIVRCTEPTEIPEGAGLLSAGRSARLDLDDRRVIVRSFTLVPPDRVDEVARQDRLESAPRALYGETVPKTYVQNENFYTLACRAAREA